MASNLPLLLLIEDDLPLQQVLETSLTAHSYRVVTAGTAREARAHAMAYQPEVILLDLGLPDGDGLELTREFRLRSTTPIIIISARGQERDKVAALDLGADDYLTKPFGLQELLARIRVALRRALSPVDPISTPVFTVGEVTVDLAARQVFRGTEEIHLTPTEYRLLTVLVRHAGKVMTHRQLLEAVWGGRDSDQTRYLRVYMAQLRRKVERDPARPQWLRTEPGVGYRLVVSP